LFLEECPRINLMPPRGTARALDINDMAAALAFPSSGGAVTRIRSTPSLKPNISVLEALGWTLTDRVQAFPESFPESFEWGI
jgi:hypothetical protein